MPPAGQIQIKGPRDWIGYWDQDRLWSGSELWKVNAGLFFRRFGPIVGLKETDTVANIGCGPGYLESRLAPRVESITSADTSERLVELCRRNCRDHPNVTVRLLGEDYTDLTPLGERRFSLILCVSVVQYYRAIGEIESLIRSAKEIALPGARMLIADLPRPRGPLGSAWDASCSLLLSIREGYLFPFLRTAWGWLKERRKNRSFHERVASLYFSEGQMQGLIRRMNLDASVIKTDLSVCANRFSLILWL